MKVCPLLLGTLAAALVSPTPLLHHNGLPVNNTVNVNALESVLTTMSDAHNSLVFITDGTNITTSFFNAFLSRRPHIGLSAFEVSHGQDANTTQAQFSWLVSQARQLRQVSWSVMVVVVSDDPAFLTAFAEWSLKGRLLVWSTRLIAVTRIPVTRHQILHKTFSSMNAMIMSINDSSKDYRFLQRPTLALATEAFHAREVQRADPSGRRKDHTAEYLAQGMNFSYRYVHTPDGTFGSKQQDGSWSGMIGLVARREADFSIGPFSLSESRSEVIDFTHPVLVQYNMILGGRGRPEVNPWGFFLPLQPMVWLAIVISLLALPTLMYLLSYCQHTENRGGECWPEDTFTMVRVLLQQDSWLSGWRWWRRLGLAGWMFAAVVVVRSYAGNLMSVLAVRHIQQPYQSLRHVLDDPHVTMVWQTNTSNVQYYRSVESGIYREVREAEEAGRVRHHTIMEFFKVISTMVRPGHHVLVDLDLMLLMMIGQDFSITGRCDFYTSKERFLPVMLSMIGQKDSPLVPALSKRMSSVAEAGLYYQWVKTMVPNSTSCHNLPTRITVSTTLALTNLWGMFAVLAGGHAAGLLILLFEIVYKAVGRWTNADAPPHFPVV